VRAAGLFEPSRRGTDPVRDCQYPQGASAQVADNGQL
jgi:hypothetical protein